MPKPVPLETKPLRTFTVLFFLSSLPVFLVERLSPSFIWLFGVLGFLVPLMVVVFLVTGLILTVTDAWYSLFSWIGILLCSSHLWSLYPLRWAHDSNDFDLKVLSYNVHVFNSFDHLKSDKEYGSSKRIIKFLSTCGADIVCLQEYYQDERSRVFDIGSRLKNTYPHKYVSESYSNKYGQRFGLAIYSKYKLRDKGTITFSKNTKNHAIYADVVWEGRAVRIYNIHLQSMAIDERHITEAEWSRESGKNILKVLSKYKRGMNDRALQSEILLRHLEESGKSALVCGDINDLPLSYTYRNLRKSLKNAHEERGMGLGETYNGKLRGLRIDHIFSTKDIDIVGYKVKEDIRYSDHLPIEAKVKMIN